VFELILVGVVEKGIRKQLFWMHFINKQTLFLKSFAIMRRGREKFLQSHFFLFSLLDHPITQRAMTERRTGSLQNSLKKSINSFWDELRACQ
jgi:hypothetical protein